MGSVQDADCKPVGSYPPSGIDVLIVGTGLAGLTASIECVRKGHNVRIIERHQDINTAGDMYFMGHSATKFFRHWPELSREYEMISMNNAWIETFKHSGERVIAPLKVSDRLRQAGMDPNTPPGAFQMRPLIYRMYLNEVQRQGIKIQFDQRVVDYYEDEERQKAGVVTDKGVRFEADVVIAADGVGSKGQKLVGGQVKAISAGRAMWRAAFPMHHLDKNPELKKFLQMGGQNGDEPMVRTWLGPGSYAMVLIRRETCVWIMNHDVFGSEEENWNHTVGSDDVLNNMDRGLGPFPWDSRIKELVKLTPPNTIVNFELFWRDPQPSWTSPGARVVLIGDAAHSFLPASGNGATQAIEDAVTVATCLQLAGKENVPEAIRTHVRFRFIRCSCAQKMGFQNAERLQHTDWQKVKVDPKLAQPKLPRWIWKHDPEQYAYENYAKMVDTIRKGIPFDQVDTVPPNYPPGYKYKPWSIESMQKEVDEATVDMGSGDWD
ncbi:FAD/NAD(P)-binding domain-containing protein [Hypoxylon trugodes]|uniref:FAD/NAD(P)-binding domain-containing protein n=1 Tax=Hypoxylon trugodes TaxID=326681 RepID=UPI00219F8A49|nr:FAD/NAD(P)-binding domain-containing protein [Hypoxylon trugodes]KAI1393124.1 FAD/NAD(P)-binding domain-containing protein [Hypoxylon trugodes]